jgi:hypothetical protein
MTMTVESAEQKLEGCALCNELRTWLDAAARVRGFESFSVWVDAGQPAPPLLKGNEELCGACTEAVSVLEDAELEAEAKAAGFESFEAYVEHVSTERLQ